MLLAAATVVASASTGAAYAVAGTGKPTKAKPTVVLVHGAFADSSGWNDEISRLQRRGYPVVAVPNPLRGLTSDAAYVRSVLQSIPGPVVLVGHSYGGAVITNAATGMKNVKALVYVGAFIPAKNENVATILDPAKYPGSLLGPATTAHRKVANPAAPGGTDTETSIKPADFRRVFAADLPARKAALLAATQRPMADTAAIQPSGNPAWATIPSWDLITLDDKAIPPAGQQFMAQRAHARVQTVHSSHAVMLAHPDAVVRIVMDAAHHTS
ncbi:alpha/beta hydrolase [Actinomadura barringtoniae]|uniref:Alpha/beta hydrolase n=2 Tax=Actinomadura barringtoniae TaxID=1427535 RepID=A0A939PJB4_9ACTN|nr:alpha/beta hydrolase [Actinomadura barringtoniae]